MRIDFGGGSVVFGVLPQHIWIGISMLSYHLLESQLLWNMLIGLLVTCMLMVLYCLVIQSLRSTDIFLVFEFGRLIFHMVLAMT